MVDKFPQAFDRVTTLRLHLSLILSLLPVAAVAVWLHGWWVFALLVLSVASAWGADEVLYRLRGRQGGRDWSAPLWGLMLGFLLPAQAPLYLPVVGGFFAVLVVKGLLGGGTTPWVNPVLAAWAFLQAGWPRAFPALTPLATDHRSAFDQQATDWLNSNLFSWLSIQLPPGYLDLIVGLGRPETGLIVESGALILLAATVFLLVRGYFPWQIPLVFFLGFALPMVLTGGNVLYQVFTGGLLLNLFFLASDPTSRPLGVRALVIYAGGAGVLSFLLRTWGVGTDVGYAVLLMNLLVPWMDRAWKRKDLNDLRVA
jgi:electron transport complex protein RnfD